MIDRATFLLLAGLSSALAIAAAGPAVAQSNACAQGFVPRLANSQDQVCVTPQAQAQAAADNSAAAGRVASAGSDACRFGYVWRLANPQDHVCVTQQTRDEVASDNAAAASRLAATAQSKPAVQLPATVPSPPAVVKEGCQRNVNGEWQDVPCATPGYIKEHYPPPEWQFSLKSDPKLITPVPGKPPILYTLPLEWGSVLVALLSDPKTTTETDNHFGVNAYSVQNNTNFFTGSNGHTDWVQFVDQSKPGQSDGVCIWNVDVTVAVATKNQQGYTPTCVSAPRTVPDKPLTGPNASTGVPIVVTGYVAAPRAGSSTGYLVLYAQLPDAGGWWSVTAPDTYGLSGSWTEISGSIMGLGGASQATFAHASVETLLGARSCIAPYTASSCPSGNLPTEIIHELTYYAAPYYSGVTGESNNLVPVIGSPPAHEPTTLSCVTDFCELWYVADAP